MTEAARSKAKRRRLVTGMCSLGVHAAFLAALLLAQPDARPPADLAPIQVQLMQLPPPQPPKPPAPPEPAPEPKPAPPKPAPPKIEKQKPTPPRRAVARPARAPLDIDAILAEAGPVTNLAAEVSDAELASAATAGSGGGGGGGGQCNMVGWLQKKLRSDRRVQAAMAEAHTGRAIRVWNGDWIRHPGQEGNGLAAVREAIMWEVAFAPEACRKQRVRGLIVVSLDDQPGSARVVMGVGDWRWSDLLFSRSRGG